MRKDRNLIAMLVGVLIFGFAASDFVMNIKYSVKNIEGIWYVVNERNQPLPIRAKANDLVEWSADGSDLTFQFPRDSHLIFTLPNGDPVPSGHIESVEDGKKLILKVKSDAPAGSYEYAVFVEADQTFARGSTPPVIIID